MKKTQRHQVTKEEISRFNMFRENMKGKVISGKEMKEALKRKMGYSSSDQMLKALSTGDNAPILHPERGKYIVNPEPVFIKRLQTCWNEYSNMSLKYAHATVDNKEKISIEDAITMLKTAGYKILKPIVQYEEI